MTRSEKKKLQADFLKAAGPNATTFKAMMDCLPDVAFYMKDIEGRIMALNRRNCDFCNIHHELDAVGKHSDDLFPYALAQDYIAYDQLVRTTGKPLINERDQHSADRSTDYHVKSVFPLRDITGKIIGTTCIYYKVPSVDGAPDWHGILKPITEYVAAHYAEDITLDQLAQLVGTSSVNFRRQFTRTFGISPGRYITTIRLNAVRKLLETTEKLVSEIAAETGFWDQSHLTKLFKRERGITPGEYRRRHRTS
jgi:AraC-like DNA-binding protein